MADSKKSKKDSKKEEFDRLDPEGTFDQGETEQVGGTVVNRPLQVENTQSKSDKDADKHHINEMEDNDS